MANVSPDSSLLLPVLAFFSVSAGVFWPYFAGMLILDIGLVLHVKKGLASANGLNNLVQFGPLFLAVAMAIFGADHLTAARFVALLVPSWIPGRLFWAYFVGFALLAAALSLATQIEHRLAAWLLGIMIFLFIPLIHLPSCFARPFDHTRVTILLRDLLLSSAVLAFAASLPKKVDAQRQGKRFPSREQRVVRSRLAMSARFVIAFVFAVFGVNHFLHPALAP
jgi:uncharacterized membrane protein